MKKTKCNSHQCQCPHCLQKEDHPDKDLHRQFNVLLSRINEQQQRCVAAFLSKWIGFGGIRKVQVMTGMSRATIYQGLHELNDGLQDRPPNRTWDLYRVRRPGGGRHRKLTDDQLKRLEQLLSEGATAHGWQNNLWTAERVAQVIRKHLGVTLCIATVRRMLKEQIGWSLQKPAVQLRNRNDDEIARWRTKVFPGIVKKSRDRQSHLTFIDESGFMLSPTLRRTYAPRGHAPIIKVSDPHARISVIAAITLSPGHRQVRLTFQMLSDNANFHGESVAEFLRTLSRSVKGPNTIIWDSVRIHLAHVVQSYLSTRDDIVTETFPSNASDLNPVDSVWSYIKYARLPNYTPFDLIQMRRRLTAELRRLQGRQDLLLSFISRAGLSNTREPLGSKPGIPEIHEGIRQNRRYETSVSGI